MKDFARVYDEHVWRVYGYLAYRVRGRELAEDLTQSTFDMRCAPGRALTPAGLRWPPGFWR